jgi:hypothetical protein
MSRVFRENRWRAEGIPVRTCRKVTQDTACTSGLTIPLAPIRWYLSELGGWGLQGHESDFCERLPVVKIGGADPSGRQMQPTLQETISHTEQKPFKGRKIADEPRVRRLRRPAIYTNYYDPRSVVLFLLLFLFVLEPLAKTGAERSLVGKH